MVSARSDDPGPPLPTTALAATEGWRVGALVAGRYEISGRLGGGGFGEVYSAADRGSGREVAIKALLRAGAGAGAARFPREVRALSLLGFPGVVRLLGEGTHLGIPFLVLEKVEGTPFPGSRTPLSWSELEGVAIALLEALARIHSLGIIHRDLKPANVLVDAHGVPTILDLGLAWGPDLGPRLTGEQHWLGTPHYLAPEQWGGNAIDARADLHSVGVMLYEALAGRLPFPGRGFAEIFLAKTRGSPVPLGRLVPAVPDRVADGIARLLAPEPRSRPASVEELLRILRGGGTGRSERHLPWLGDRAPLGAIRAAIEEGRPLDIRGSEGSGRSRVLEEAAEIARELGREVRHAVPAGSPLASLGTFHESRADPDPPDLAGHSRLVGLALERFLAAGGVLIADDTEQLDRSSQRVIERCRAAGSVLRTLSGESGGDLRLEPLAEQDLRALFHGPDRLHHLREDAACELHRRTAGIPRLVVEELGAWERAGLCRREDGHWRIRRAMLDRLEAGFELSAGLRIAIPKEPLSGDSQRLLAAVEIAFPHSTPRLLARLVRRPLWEVEAELATLEEDRTIRLLGDGTFAAMATGQPARVWTADELRRVHAEIAGALPPGEISRLYHLIAAADGRGEDAEALADEALAGARRFEESGRTSLAVAALQHSLEVVRDRRGADGAGGGNALETRLLTAWAALACSLGAAAVRDVLAATADAETVDGRALARFLERYLRCLESGGRLALEALREVPPLADPRLEAIRRVGMFRAARALEPAEGDPLIDEILDELVETGEHALEPAILDCRGQMLHRLARYRESAEWHARAASVGVGRARVASLVNAVISWIEAGEFGRAGEACATALGSARGMRHAPLELWAIHLGRVIEYRAGPPPLPDRELVELAREVATPSMRGAIALSEAAIARRAGDPVLAGELAEAAAEDFAAAGMEAPSALSAILAESLRPEPAAERIAAAWRPLAGAVLPGLSLQGLALGGAACGLSAAERRSCAVRFAERLGDYPRMAPREVLSIAESIELASGGR